MHSDYLNSAIRQLRDQQIQSVPREQLLERVTQAEQLLTELEPAHTYLCGYICWRITSEQSNAYPDVQLTGREATHDLRLFVEDASEAANVVADAAREPVLTVDTLARRFNVSTKTILRWRQQGLIGRRFVVDGRTRIGFLESSVNRFVERNRQRVERGTQFSQLSREERATIIDQAHHLARAGACPADVTGRLSRMMGRSPETIRSTIRQFDREHPEEAVFPENPGPLQAEAKRQIYQQHQRGASVDDLAKRFRRTRTSIYRIIAEVRAQRIMDLPLDYMPNDAFVRVRSKKMEDRIVAAMPDSPSPLKKIRVPKGLPPYLASLYEVPLLTREQEAHLFRKMNYLKYKARGLRATLDPSRPKRRVMDEIERLCDEAVSTKNQLIRANLRLVASIAKRHVGPAQNFFELVSDGNMSLMRAVEKFDYARGNKFSTYASWAIMKNFARTIPDEHRQRGRFCTSQAEIFTTMEDARTDQVELESSQAQRQVQVERILRCLDDRERTIIVRRFGLRRGEEPLTLKQIGAEVGVTKERIRQIEARAMTKLRTAAEAERIDVPG